MELKAVHVCEADGATNFAEAAVVSDDKPRASTDDHHPAHESARARDFPAVDIGRIAPPSTSARIPHQRRPNTPEAATQ